MFLRRSNRLGTGLSVTDGRRRLECVTGGEGRGGTRDKCGGSPDPRFFQTPRTRGAVEAHEVCACVCVGGGAPATQASVTPPLSHASLWLAGKGIWARAKMRLGPAGTFFFSFF